MCVKIKIVITIRYTFDNMKWYFKQYQGITRFNMYLLFYPTQHSSLKQLHITLFDNEHVALILCVKRTIIITIRYKYGHMKWYLKFQGIPRFNLYLLLELTQRSSLKQLQITLLGYEQVAIILCVKRTIVITIRYTYDNMELS